MGFSAAEAAARGSPSSESSDSSERKARRLPRQSSPIGAPPNPMQGFQPSPEGRRPDLPWFRSLSRTPNSIISVVSMARWTTLPAKNSRVKKNELEIERRDGSNGFIRLLGKYAHVPGRNIDVSPKTASASRVATGSPAACFSGVAAADHTSTTERGNS
jgi:hypothetical protein